MKKTFILLAVAAIIASCGGNENKPAGENGAAGTGTETGAGAGAGTETGAGTSAQTGDISTHPDYQKGLALIGKSDCFSCHKVSEKIVGPAYQEVADRYAGKPGIEDSLAGKIINGGAGNWGEVPMTPHPNLSKEDAVAMVKYILLLKQKS